MVILQDRNGSTALHYAYADTSLTSNKALETLVEVGGGDLFMLKSNDGQFPHKYEPSAQ